MIGPARVLLSLQNQCRQTGGGRIVNIYLRHSSLHPRQVELSPYSGTRPSGTTVFFPWYVTRRITISVPDVLYSADGRWFVSCGKDGRVVVWDAQTRRRAFALECPE